MLPVAVAAAGIKPKHVAYAVAGVGVLALGGAALWWWLSRPEEEREKKPGDKVGATLRLLYQGEPLYAWLGFGIGPGHQDPVTMSLDRWVGSWVDIPGLAELMLVEFKVEGIFPPDLPEGVWVDCIKIIAPSAPPYSAASHARRYASDWDDEVYYVLKSGEED